MPPQRAASQGRLVAWMELVPECSRRPMLTSARLARYCHQSRRRCVRLRSVQAGQRGGLGIAGSRSRNISRRPAARFVGSRHTLSALSLIGPNGLSPMLAVGCTIARSVSLFLTFVSPSDFVRRVLVSLLVSTELSNVSLVFFSCVTLRLGKKIGVNPVRHGAEMLPFYNLPLLMPSCAVDISPAKQGHPRCGKDFRAVRLMKYGVLFVLAA